MGSPVRLGSLAFATCALMGLVGSATAHAHIRIDQPTPRYSNNQLKTAPCGQPNNPPGEVEPTVIQGGESLTVVITEYVEHTGHIRIALAPSDSEFVSPTGFDDFYNAPNVLIDDYTDPPGSQVFEIPVEIPNIGCDTCVLQVIQVMYGGEFGPEDLYFDCADVVIEKSVAATSGGAGDTSEGGEATDDGQSSVGTTTSAGGDSSAGGDGHNEEAGQGTTGTSANASDTGGGHGEESTAGAGCRVAGDPSSSALVFLTAMAALRLRRRKA